MKLKAKVAATSLGLIALAGVGAGTAKCSGKNGRPGASNGQSGSGWKRHLPDKVP